MQAKNLNVLKYFSYVNKLAQKVCALFTTFLTPNKILKIKVEILLRNALTI